MPIERLQKAINAETESETEYDGYVSYRAEWHAAAWGFAVGFLYAVTGSPAFLVSGVGWLFTRHLDDPTDVPERIPYRDQLFHESLYVIGHVPAGVLVGLAFSYAVSLSL